MCGEEGAKARACRTALVKLVSPTHPQVYHHDLEGLSSGEQLVCGSVSAAAVRIELPDASSHLGVPPPPGGQLLLGVGVDGARSE